MRTLTIRVQVPDHKNVPDMSADELAEELWSDGWWANVARPHFRLLSAAIEVTDVVAP